MRKYLLIAFVGMILGVIGWGGFNTAMEATNRMSFCISCHAMRDTVYAEYIKSPHFENPSGVRATCADCHVPRDWTHKVLRKFQATGELYAWATGAIDTPEKFEAKRHELAKHEWSRMRANDSRECKNCHSFEAMAFHKQNIKAARAMRDAAKAGKTCIDCHKAIAHKMPDVTATHRRMFHDLTPDRVSAGDTVTALIPHSLKSTVTGTSIGELLAGNSLDIMSLVGDSAQVTVKGWTRDGDERKLYTRQGARITLATLNPEQVQNLETLRTVEDETSGRVWSEVQLTAWVQTNDYVKDPVPLWNTVRQMYDDNCSLCHAVHEPNEYTADTWIGHVKSMTRMTRLTPQESALLLIWLQDQAKE